MMPPPAGSAPASAPDVPTSTAVTVKPMAWPLWVALGSAVLAVAASAVAWTTRGNQQSLERELVKRQSESQTLVVEAKALARAAEEAARDAQVKATMLETRLAETTAQRSQLESLMLTLSQSRDENAVGEMDALIRAAMAQSTWTGRTEPLLAALKHTDERLAVMQAPRLAVVRKAVARDIERLGAASVIDAAALSQRIDAVLVQVDELPLTIQVATRMVGDTAAAPRASAPATGTAATPSKPNAGRASTTPLDTPAIKPDTSPAAPASWREQGFAAWAAWRDSVAREARALLRISRIDQPSAMLLAPEQAYFVRENIKLRLLSARLAVQSRQVDVAQRDVREVQKMLDTYFDPQSKRTLAAKDSLQQVATNLPTTPLPRPDETLSALVLLGKTK